MIRIDSPVAAGGGGRLRAGAGTLKRMVQAPTVVILAAGLGTRMKSRIAKVLHRAGGRTLVEHVVASALEITSPDRIFAVIGHQAAEVRRVLEPLGVGSIEQAEQKGTGHALMAGRDQLEPLDGPLLVLYGDCPLIAAETLRNLVAMQAGATTAATVITTVLDEPTGYGRILHDAHGNVAAIVEQKAGSPEQLAVREINSGIYCFRPDLLWRHIGEIVPDNPAGEFYLTDIVEIFNRHGQRVGSMQIDDASEVLGINNRVELAAIDRLVRDRTAQRLMLEGVTIEKPETVTIDPQVRIGIDTVIEPFAQVLGSTVIGEASRIGACSIVRDSQLGDRVEVGPFTVIGRSRIASDAQVGPFARLRFDNDVESGAQIGNFVELKKTRLGAGSKAMHLSYLGDSQIGKEVNIGAGTITCNYDGRKKHPTVIGDRAFIGSHGTLVAPVEIGRDAYTAAGSVVTENVPPDALALGRARQLNKEGWARKRREHTSS